MVLEEKYLKCIIRTEQKVCDLVKLIERLEKQTETQQTVCSQRVQYCNGVFAQKVSSKWFQWIIGIAASVIIGIGLLTLSTNIEVSKTSSTIQQHILYTPHVPRPTTK